MSNIVDKFNGQEYHANHRLVGYVAKDYKAMVQGMSVNRNVSEAHVVATAVMKYFDSLPKEQRAEYIKLSESKTKK